MTERFNTAVTKLYTAYHNGELNSDDCSACAVGNMCDNQGSWWENVYNARPDGKKYSIISYAEKTQLKLERTVLECNVIKRTGYSGNELAQVESIFIKHTMKKENRETQFNGLCAVIEYLAELDGISNPFDFGNLFNEDTEIAERELKTVLL